MEAHSALFDFTFNQLGAGYRPGERVPHACQNGAGNSGESRGKEAAHRGVAIKPFRQARGPDDLQMT